MNQEKAKRRENFYIHSSIVVGGTCRQFFVAVTAAIGEENRTGHLIKGTPVSQSKPNTCRLVNQPMGVNTLYTIGKDVAIKVVVQ